MIKPTRTGFRDQQVVLLEINVADMDVKFIEIMKDEARERGAA